MNDALLVRESLASPWRPWVVGGSILQFVWLWTLSLVVLVEALDWLWPALAQALPPAMWHGLKVTVVAIGLWWVLRQAFKPLQTLGKSLDSMPSQAAAQIAEHQPAELKQLAAAVRRLLQTQQSAVDEQRKFLANASHQLQTPFAVLRAQLQGVMANQLPASDTLPKMLSTVDRSSVLVRQLLSLAKVDQLARQSDWQDVELSGVAREVVLEFAPLLARKKLDFSLQAVPVRLSTDAWLLGELVRNLLSNAIKHTPQGGALGLVIRVLSSGAELLVWDNGGGLDEAIQGRLFEPFQSASGAQGVGLGLSICRQIALSMNAVVDLYNRVQDDRVVGVDAVVRWPHEPEPVAAP